MAKFKSIQIDAPDHDFDLTIVWPNGEEITIQARPSNADVNYNGSLDIILPRNQAVTNWEGDEMKPAKSVHGQDETRLAKQLVMELPCNLSEVL